jgi:hypothetical protein
MFESIDGWWKVWFFLRNDADALLPMFTGSHPVPQPNWGGGSRVTTKDLHKLQSLHEWGYRVAMSMNLVRTFFSRRVQPLRQWKTTMWMYLGPSCPDRSFYEESGDVEINTRIHRALAHVVDLNPGVSPSTLREGVDSTRVCLFASAFGSLHNLICSFCSCLLTGSCVCS